MTKTAEKLSIPQARKMILLSQKIPPVKHKLNPVAATLAVIEHLGYIQIDTISVIQRAHHHTIWNRNPNYQLSHLDELVANKQVFEYWSHAAAYLPMKDYRYSLPRKNAYSDGSQKHWFNCSEILMKSVLDRIKAEGPLMAKDFDKHTANKKGDWTVKPSKQALSNLFMQGDLMVTARNSFHKVFDIPERVLPANIDNTTPSSEEYFRFLITRYLEANAIGEASQIAYLLKNTKSHITKALAKMLENGDVKPIQVKGNLYYTLPNSLELLDQSLSKSKLRILSPFDNLIIQRKRAMDFFDFDYLLECYVPAAKRKFGYFTLPILWDGKLLARMDCKVDRKSKVLHIHKLLIEPKLKRIDAFARALSNELKAFLKFNQCNSIKFNEVNPASLKVEINKLLEQ